MNCTCSESSFTKLQYRCTLASSSGASTSSNTQKGAGFNLKIAKTNAKAVKVFSPPESSAKELLRYLWDTPHALANDKLTALIGAEPHTPLPVAAQQALADLGLLATALPAGPAPAAAA